MSVSGRKTVKKSAKYISWKIVGKNKGGKRIEGGQVSYEYGGGKSEEIKNGARKIERR